MHVYYLRHPLVYLFEMNPLPEGSDNNQRRAQFNPPERKPNTGRCEYQRTGGKLGLNAFAECLGRRGINELLSRDHLIWRDIRLPNMKPFSTHVPRRPLRTRSLSIMVHQSISFSIYRGHMASSISTIRVSSGSGAARLPTHFKSVANIRDIQGIIRRLQLAIQNSHGYFQNPLSFVGALRSPRI